MKAIRSGPVMPSGFDAQSLQRYGGSIACRNFFPASFDSSSRTCSISFRNFRNMIQVSIGSRSRSPFKPLSFRIMSRLDLTMLPSCWAVDFGTSILVLRGVIEEGFKKHTTAPAFRRQLSAFYRHHQREPLFVAPYHALK